jgi:hypothetical protein
VKSECVFDRERPDVEVLSTGLLVGLDHLLVGEIVEREWRLQGLQELQTESGGGWRARLGFGGDGESTSPFAIRHCW